MTASGQAANAAISPDGKYIAYVQNDALRLRKLDSESDLEIEPPNNAHPRKLVFSPDGERLYYTHAGGNLYSIPMLGGMAKKICSGLWNESDTISFSPRGDQFVFSSADGQAGEDRLFLARADGSGERPIAVVKLPQMLQNPAWSPRGDVIAYTATPKGFFRFDLVIQAPRAGAPVRILTPDSFRGDVYSAWIEKGAALAFSAENRARGQRQIWTITYPAGVLRRVTNDLDSYVGVGVSADSRILVTTRIERTTALWLVPPSQSPSSEAPHPITTAGTTLDGWDALAWMPDKRIIFSSLMSGSGELWIADIDGRRKRLTDFNAQNQTVSVSHDGRFILFTSNRTGGTNLWRMDLDSNNVSQLTSGNADFNGVLSCDDKWVVFISMKSGKRQLHKMSIAGGQDTIVSSIPVFRFPPAVSPDNRFIAFGFIDTVRQVYQLGVIPFGGGNPIARFDVPGPSRIEWTRDGKGLTYIATRDGVDNLWVQPLAGGPPRQITNFNEGRIFRFAWRWDGKLLALARGEETSDIVALRQTD